MKREYLYEKANQRREDEEAAVMMTQEFMCENGLCEECREMLLEGQIPDCGIE